MICGVVYKFIKLLTNLSLMNRDDGMKEDADYFFRKSSVGFEPFTKFLCDGNTVQLNRNVHILLYRKYFSRFTCYLLFQNRLELNLNFLFANAYYGTYHIFKICKSTL